MNQLNEQVIWAAIIGFIVGAIIVWLLKRGGSSKSETEALQADYDKLKKEHKAYQDKVNAHFAKTADAVDQLTKSYQDVFAHLSQGAETLMDKATLKQEIEKRQGKAVTLAYLTDDHGKESEKTIRQDSVVASKPMPGSLNKDGKPAPTAGDTSQSKPMPTAVAKANDSKTEEKKTPVAKPAEKPASSVDTQKTSEKSAAQLAAEKAGLKPGVDTEKKPNESSIDAVKRHIRDNQPNGNK